MFIDFFIRCFFFFEKSKVKNFDLEDFSTSIVFGIYFSSIPCSHAIIESTSFDRAFVNLLSINIVWSAIDSFFFSPSFSRDDRHLIN